MLGGQLSSEKWLGQRIREFRVKRGRSQKALAEMCNLSESAIRNYELGNRIPSPDILHDIADALHINYYALADPTFETPDGVMHILFQLESLYGLRPIKIDGKTCLAIDTEYSDFNGDDLKLQEMLDEWCRVEKKWAKNVVTAKKYEKWMSRFPDGPRPHVKKTGKSLK